MKLSFRKVRNLSVCSLLAIAISFNLFAYFTMQGTASHIETSISLGQTKLIKWSSFLEAIRDSKDYLYRYYAGQENFISPVTLLINNAVTQVKDISELEQQTESQTVDVSLVNDLLANLEQYKQAVITHSANIRDAHIHSRADTQIEQLMLNKANRIVEISQAAVNDIHYHMKHQTDQIIAMNRFSQIVLLAGLVLSIILTVTVTLFMTRALSTPMKSLIRMAQFMARGNYRERISLTSRDEIGQLADAFNNMAEIVSDRTQDLLTTNETLKQEIAERKRTEATLENLNKELTVTIQQLAESNREIREYHQAAYHDLSEPLRKINAFAELLLQSLEGKLNRDEVENLNFIIEGARRMRDSVDGLVTYSRIAEQDIHLNKVDLNTMVEQITNSDLAEVIQRTGTIITVPESLQSVMCESVQISEVLKHLISNAIKYQRKGNKPQIAIRSGNVNNMVRIEVQDNGIGIKQEFFADIFNMFRRLNPRDQYEGTGIGLALCKKIIQHHNGTIGVHSTYGQGSTFWFTLPQAPQEQPPEESIKSGHIQNPIST